MIYGHEDTWDRLRAELPPVVLLRGPRSVGKHTMAKALVAHHGALTYETRDIDPLTSELAREIKLLCTKVPMGPMRAFIIAIDTATEAALNTMLKTLEEPPPFARFILLAEQPTLVTIASRSVVCPMGLLSDDAMRALLSHRGMVGTPLELAILKGGGQVDTATGGMDLEAGRAKVVSVINALSRRDVDLLNEAMSEWSDEAHALLRVWCTEAVTRRWRVFNETEAFGLGVSTPFDLLRRLDYNARPKLTARVAVERMISAA